MTNLFFLISFLLGLSIVFGSYFVSYANENNKIPRFASLKADEVNLRIGPNKKDFPIEWVYKRRGLPVEITAVSDTWRRIRDHEGTTGWVWHSLISSKRTVIVIDENRTLHYSPDYNSKALAILEPGVIGNLLACTTNWCQIELRGKKGWLKRSHIWGVRN